MYSASYEYLWKHPLDTLCGRYRPCSARFCRPCGGWYVACGLLLALCPRGGEWRGLGCRLSQLCLHALHGFPLSCPDPNGVLNSRELNCRNDDNATGKACNADSGTENGRHLPYRRHGYNANPDWSA